MGLDTRYIPSKYFQEYLVDKDTGEPLAAGVVTFYRDNARIELKPMYQITGTPPNYTYAALPNPLTLNAIGTFEDGIGNDVIPYFYPYDVNGNIDLYYITVESSGAVSQFSREGEPNVSEEEETDVELDNYAANGQFLLHQNIAASDENSTEAGEITQDITDIAYGGWTYERTAGSTAKDFVLFERFGSYTEVPQKSPRYSCRIKSDTPVVTDAFKHLALTFNDVNKFSSDIDKFTLAFQGKSNLGGSFTVEVKLIKNYGSGGDPQEETILQTIELTTDYTIHDVSFVFGSNNGKVIGNNNDDYLQLVLSFPATTVFDGSFDNFLLAKGEFQTTEFPDIPDERFINHSLTNRNMLPDYNGRNIYLPVRLGPEGLEYDTEIIGNYVTKSFDNLAKGELWCDGSKYLVDEYSGDGVPFIRLYDIWSSQSPVAVGLYGPGDDEMIFSHTATAVDQKFTHDYDTLGSYETNSVWQSFTAGVTGSMTSVALEFPGGPETTPATLEIYSGEGTGGALLSTQPALITGGWSTYHLVSAASVTATQQYTISITATDLYYLFIRGSDNGGYAGGRFSQSANEDACFKTFVDAGATTTYRLSSTSAGAVVATADGATPTGFTFTPVAPNPYEIDITAVAASGMTAGSYFTYNTTDSRKYIVWYTVDAAGTQPVEAADVYREVALLSTDDALNVANKTSKAINSYSYKVPDARGYFMRIVDDGAARDPDAATRTNRGDLETGDIIGTLQGEQFKAHTHTAHQSTTLFLDIQGASNKTLPQPPSTIATGSAGGTETRPINIYVKLAVKY